jgi:hypothetical protein
MAVLSFAIAYGCVPGDSLGRPVHQPVHESSISNPSADGAEQLLEPPLLGTARSGPYVCLARGRRLVCRDDRTSTDLNDLHLVELAESARDIDAVGGGACAVLTNGELECVGCHACMRIGDEGCGECRDRHQRLRSQVSFTQIAAPFVLSEDGDLYRLNGAEVLPVDIGVRFRSFDVALFRFVCGVTLEGVFACIDAHTRAEVVRFEDREYVDATGTGMTACALDSAGGVLCLGPSHSLPSGHDLGDRAGPEGEWSAVRVSLPGPADALVGAFCAVVRGQQLVCWGPLMQSFADGGAVDEEIRDAHTVFEGAMRKATVYARYNLCMEMMDGAFECATASPLVALTSILPAPRLNEWQPPPGAE